MSGLLCAGDVYFDRFSDAGASTGLVLLGNTNKLEVQESSDLKERISRQRDTFGAALDSVYIKKPTTLSLGNNEFNKDNLAMALLGSVAPLNVGAGSLTDEVLAAKTSKFVQLSKGNLTDGSVVVTNSAATTTYVLGTDYEVHYRLGMIKALEDGAITDGQSLKVDADYGAVSGNEVLGGVQPTIRGRLLLDGKNLANGQRVQLEIYSAVLSPTSAVDFAADDFSNLELAGQIVVPEGYTEGYKVTFFD